MPGIPVVKGRDADLAYEAAQCVVETHRNLSRWLRLGVTLPQVDRFVAESLDSMGGRSAFLGYRAPRLPKFPSHACLSVNDCVVHGTAGSYLEPMREGDVLKVDIGIILKGWFGDAAWTYVFGQPDEEVARLCESGKRSLREGIRELRPGNRLIEWAKTVQRVVEEEDGFHLVRGLGGHGYGRKLHTAPFVSNVVPFSKYEWHDADLSLAPGTLLAVEPMLAAGTSELASHGATWPVHSRDGSMTVHYEHDVLVTDDGPKVMTEGLDDLADVIDR